MDRRIRGLLIGLAVLVVVGVAFSDLMGGMMGPGFAGQGPGGPGMMQGPWWMWGLSMFIFWGVLLIGLALVARALGVGRGRQRSPLDVLKRRYAAGDLTREQYEQMRKDLEQ
jgi:putative membrane protein